MNFKVKAKIDKLIKSGDTWFMYSITDLNSKNGNRYTVFTSTELNTGSSYDLDGYIKTSKDKNTKDQNGKDIYRTSFNVTEYAETF